MDAPTAAGMLGHPDRSARVGAADRLRLLPPAQTIPALCRITLSDSWRARGNAAFLLGEIHTVLWPGWNQSLIALRHLVAHEPNEQVRSVALDALARVERREPSAPPQSSAPRKAKRYTPSKSQTGKSSSMASYSAGSVSGIKKKSEQDTAPLGSPHDLDLHKRIGPTIRYGDDT